MSADAVEELADAVLYEGYNLYPYRPSALKNRHRWLFGCVLPKSWCEFHRNGDRWYVQTQCLLVGSPKTTVEIRVRFLQPVTRIVGRLGDSDRERPPAATTRNGTSINESGQDVVEVDEDLLPTWHEAEEHCIGETFRLEKLLDRGGELPITISAQRACEIQRAEAGDAAGTIVRGRSIAAQLRVDCERCSKVADLFRLTVRVENVTDLPRVPALARDDALLSSLVSMHTILCAGDGEFVSSIDPPSRLREAADSCDNIGTWPVLVGDRRRPATMLSAAIILEDFPQIAPESPGDLFDGTEIDELLSLRIRTLTDEEKREAASADERTCQLLGRTETLADERMRSLHGTQRTGASHPVDRAPFQSGDRVRLRPRRRADAFDLLLDGKTAVISAVECDFENDVHLAVTIDDDPGKDLGLRGMPGHRFFFRPEEVERLDEDQP